LAYEIERDSADLYFSYSPYPDEWMHRLYGYTVENGPLYTPERAALATSYLHAIAANLDQHLGEVAEELEQSGRDWNIVLSTDHGFEPEYYSFYPARALRDAGLTVTDEDGNVDPTRTKVFYAGDGVLRVNLEGLYAGGIVAQDEYRTVADRARRALLGIRGLNGERIVKQVVQSDLYKRGGLGGPHGGQLHLRTFPNRGYYWSSELGPAGAPLVDRNTGGYSGWHGNRVRGNRSMKGFAVLAGHQFADGVTIARARSVDLTPTAAAAVAIPAASHWSGRVLKNALPR